MLRWRLVFGTLIIAALVGLCWMDHALPLPGSVLVPIAVVFAALASGEMLALVSAGGARPLPWIVLGGNVLLVLAGWLPAVAWKLAEGARVGGPVLPPEVTAASAEWILATLALVVVLAFAGEMRRYQKPGGVTVNLAAALFAVIYVGVLLDFVVLLRLAYGVGALASLVIVVKMGDTGAYTVGRLVGRRKMAPVLSPGKTLEGAAGALLFACAASWATFTWLVPAAAPEGLAAGMPGGWLLFGLLIGGAGMLGDLAESLLKRDAGLKDSSRWMPGFGGVLDLLDSILLAAPAAYVCWVFGVVGG